MMRLILEVEGREASLRTVFEIVEKIVLGAATPGSLSIKQAVIEDDNSRIILDPAYAGDSKSVSRRRTASGGGMGG